ncbi:MAG: AAA-like domain-containing protein [Deltaproteobacteria bacterium]|jgi:hypothetical protein|nr:AAA-like domain-containing protein [Deltaproteobacteria bacterium]
MNNHLIKVFNITGPCNSSDHYLLPVLPRQMEVDSLIEGKYYFVLHAPRQSGKTTYLKALTEQINKKGDFYALYCSLESLQGVNDRKEGIDLLYDQLLTSFDLTSIKKLNNLPNNYKSPRDYAYTSKIRLFFNYICNNSDKDIILFFDEADCLSPDPLITFLRQIRLGYNNRSDENSKFPRTIALVGLRDIRDYLVHVRPEEESTGVASPFNIKQEALTLANFTQDEIGTLYRQHTEASGQIFEDSAIERAWYWSEGQPWLVNALAYRAIVTIFKNDYSKTVTADIVEQAAKEVILSRPTHLDSVMERLKEPRVRRVIDSVIVGAVKWDTSKMTAEDIQYVQDLGLLKREDAVYRPANPIYGEIIIRKLTQPIELGMPVNLRVKWTDGRTLLMTELLKAFQRYWEENAEMLGKPDNISEATPHLVCFAFMQRILNSGVDKLQREYALGKMRLDICAEYKGVSYPVELKRQDKFTDNEMTKSLNQLRTYMDKCGAKEGWLVIFDINWDKKFEEKITWKTIEYNNSTIHIVGC